MIYDVSKFEELVHQKYLRKSVKDDLVLYTYTEKCEYDKLWNEYTRVARGLILNKNTGEVVAKPFPKFFNLGAMPETYMDNLPMEGYTVSEKMDGSLGIIYYYDGKWNVATKGSFSSEQAVKAEEILKKYNLKDFPIDVTLLVEIIYPENQIVVDYKGEEKLVLIGSYDRKNNEECGFTLIELALNLISDITGIPLRKVYKYTIEQMVELQKTIPKDQEGFVVRFDNGLRLKIKGEEYLKIHKIISNLSPLSFWEVMKDGKVPLHYIQQVPEEYVHQFEPIVNELEKQYMIIKLAIQEEFEMLPTKEATPEGRKQVGIYIKNHSFFHESAMFPMLLKNEKALNFYIMKFIRPDGNRLNIL